MLIISMVTLVGMFVIYYITYIKYIDLKEENSVLQEKYWRDQMLISRLEEELRGINKA